MQSCGRRRRNTLCYCALRQSDGSVEIPDVLVPYMGGVTKIEKASSRNFA
jgi:seryl-tRNA synthetase